MSNRAGLIVGLGIAGLIVLALGVFALVAQDGDQQASPSVTPTDEQITGFVPPPEEELSPTPGEPSPGTVGQTEPPATSPPPIAGQQTTPPTQSPTPGYTPSPTATAEPPAQERMAQTGGPPWWVAGVLLLALSGVLVAMLRRTG